MKTSWYVQVLACPQEDLLVGQRGWLPPLCVSKKSRQIPETSSCSRQILSSSVQSAERLKGLPKLRDRCLWTRLSASVLCSVWVSRRGDSGLWDGECPGELSCLVVVLMYEGKMGGYGLTTGLELPGLGLRPLLVTEGLS